MQVSILKTDNSLTHTPEQWAMATASKLIEIDPKVVDERLVHAQKLQVAVMEALVAHHTKAMDAERAQLADKGDARLDDPVDPSPHVDEAMEALHALKEVHPLWAAHLADPVSREAVRNILHDHFHTVHRIERNAHVVRKGA